MSVYKLTKKLGERIMITVSCYKDAEFVVSAWNLACLFRNLGVKGKFTSTSAATMNFDGTVEELQRSLEPAPSGFEGYPVTIPSGLVHRLVTHLQDPVRLPIHDVKDRAEKLAEELKRCLDQCQ